MSHFLSESSHYISLYWVDNMWKCNILLSLLLPCSLLDLLEHPVSITLLGSICPLPIFRNRVIVSLPNGLLRGDSPPLSPFSTPGVANRPGR